ncbi:DNA polymerase IV [Halosegnis rubeus]|jgi:DNA polymerase IV (DinB-like DNA polymerase)|uniref:DNA polymerase IV n=1 Tax=Halosegnis rubeus TaxID=2212850 RepID=A0A5N5U8I5_9EURY|nr:DNA polymerase IV [Halosegnis rubeus]KAB7513738.1 DNA polymerase IV [Halosegnis rubeus]KAB7514141.1 DNA polymerase IV [Halosegnis rubeus]
MAGGTLPVRDGREQSRDRVVCHVDMDCFYAACERLREPALAGEPLVVGMGYETGADVGAVATASYEARAFGVESAMPISEALERLPRKRTAAREDDLDVSEAGFYRSVDMAYYESVSEAVDEVVERAVADADPEGVVRSVSIDEAYLDVSAVGWERAREFAADLRADVEAEVGVTASVGVAPNMSAAKVASDADKPDGLVVVPPDEVRAFLADRPVGELHGVGPVTADRLAEMGIETAADLASADPDDLESTFGSRGRQIHRHARGIDRREVEPVGKPKSISSEKALSVTDDGTTKREVLKRLAGEVTERASGKGALYKTIGVKVVRPPFDVNTRARSLSGPVDDPGLVEEIALDLLGEFSDDRVRKLGVRVSNLDFAETDQASLDSWDSGSGQSGETGSSRAGRRTRDRRGRGQTTFGDFDE